MKIQFDGDLLIYRAGFAAEKAVYYVPGFSYAEHGERVTFDNKKEAVKYCQETDLPVAQIEGERILEPVENALYNCKSMVERTMEALGSDNMTMYLSGPTNFREGVATIRPYKGNRDPDHKPQHGPAIKEYLEKKYGVVYSEDEEADDLVAYSHYAMWLEDPYSSIIASTDKDLNMVPGLHYNFIKDEQYYVDPSEGLKWFYTQLIMGDATDNIPGVPGMGKVKAARALADVYLEDKMYEIVRALYVQGYGDEADDALLENGRLLWMRRVPNEWWVPPTDCTSEEPHSESV